MATQSLVEIKQIIEAADVESFDGLQWHQDKSSYLQVQSGTGWEEGMAGVTVDSQGQVWIDGDAVAECAQDKRVEALLEAGYSTELAHSQRLGFEEQAARDILS